MECASEGNFKGNQRFTVRRRLGTGGMGVVYEVEDALTRQVVALKTLIRAEASALYRLKNEFRSLADIAHPNLVSLFELFIEADQCFFTMELVDGMDFVSYSRDGSNHVRSQSSEEAVTASFSRTQLLVEPSELLPISLGPTGLQTVQASGSNVHSPANPERLWPAMRQLAEGLCALHEGGKLHRDIKPSNILVSRTGRVVILDFGLATEVEPTDRHTRGFFGTPAYISPEQAMGVALSPASDWYGVGVTLYEALSGQLPFQIVVSAVFQACAPAWRSIESGAFRECSAILGNADLGPVNHEAEIVRSE